MHLHLHLVDESTKPKTGVEAWPRSKRFYRIGQRSQSLSIDLSTKHGVPSAGILNHPKTLTYWHELSDYLERTQVV